MAYHSKRIYSAQRLLSMTSGNELHQDLFARLRRAVHRDEGLRKSYISPI